MTQPDEEKTINRQSDAGVIAATAVKTVYWLIVAFALLFTLARLIFPAAAMNFYDSIGNIPRAYDCALMAERTSEGEKRVNARISCVNYSIALFGEYGGEYAGEVAENTARFLSDDDCLRRAKLIDEYNVGSAAKSIQPNLYSYADYLHAENARANYAVGRMEILTRDGYRGINSVLADSSVTVEQSAVIYGQIAAVLESAAKASDAAEFIDFTLLKQSSRRYIDGVLADISGTPTLGNMYLVKAYEKLAARLALAPFVTEAELAEIRAVSYGGSDYKIGELYYDVLLKQYCK